MDPIVPIPPDATVMPRTPPVDRVHRVSRERDRPARERPRGPAGGQTEDEPPEDSGEDDAPRFDVRV